MTAGFVRPLTAQEAVLAELRRMIADGRLAPGMRIVQDTLALDLGVSRVPLREALKILEGEGLVGYAAHRGYVVARLSLSDLLEVYRIRELLEAEAVALAVPLMTEEGLDRLEEAAADVEAAAERGDVTAMTVANRRLHATLIEACGLPRLVRIIAQLWDATEVYRSVYYGERPHRDVVVGEHREIVTSARARDTQRLLAVLADHRAHAVAALRPVLSRNPGPTAEDG